MAKKEKTEKVRCMNCKKSFLMQWDNNPIISQCQKAGRMVANTPHDCKSFVKTEDKKPIKHYTHFI